MWWIEKGEKMEKIEQLSKTIVDYSIDVRQDERVLIMYESDRCSYFVKTLIRDIVNRGGIPFVKYVDDEINCLLSEVTTDKRITGLVAQKRFEVDNYDSFIRIVYNKNDYEDMNVNPEILRKLGKATEEIDKIRINERKWVLLNYPSNLDAYKAKMTSRDFYQYAMDVMTVDYRKMQEIIQPLKKLMEKTDKVRLVGPDTDITFSIKNIPAIPCCGEMNIPDGEIYTAPVKNSINGTITYNTPCPYRGHVFTGVSLTFKDGKIINATCNEDNEKLNEIFDTDPGARFVGEFSLGLNPMILNPMGDILYDEKIIGSIHFTPGRCYEDANNGNVSSIHWDMVLVQRREYGGGEIYFDDELIRKDGIFVLPELEALNYNLDK